MKKIKILILLVLFISTLQANGINTILSQVIKTYGGEKNLEKLSSYKQKWNVLALAQNEKGTDNREVKLPFSLKTTLTYKNKEEIRVLTPEEKYRVFNGKKQNVDGIKAQAMQLQLKRLYSPLILKQKASKLKVEDFDTHYALVLEEDSLKIIYFVNKLNYAITQVTGYINVMNQSIVFNTLYTKFKKFDGVLVATKEYKSTNDIQTAILTMEGIEFKKLERQQK